MEAEAAVPPPLTAAQLNASLFGDSDDDDAAGAAAAAPPSGALALAPPKAEDEARAGDDAAGDDAAPDGRRRAPATGPPLRMEAPLLPPPRPGGGAVTVLRQSNIFTASAVAFDPDTHALEGEVVRGPGGGFALRSFEANVARWRPGPDGQPQSNARLVRWSDGSLQLQIGGEVLDVDERGAERDHGYLFERLPGVMACQGPLASKLVLRPSSLASRSHKLLAASLEARHAKTTRVRKFVTTHDPAAPEAAAAAAEARAQRDGGTLARRQAGAERRGDGGALGGLRGAGLSKGFLEEGEGGEGGDGDVGDGAAGGGKGRTKRSRASGGKGGKARGAKGGPRETAREPRGEARDSDGGSDGDYTEDDEDD